MQRAVLSCRTDLPFYLRLPSAYFFTWDPERECAVIRPEQRLGQVNFSRSTVFPGVSQLLDSPMTASGGLNYECVMTCATTKYGEIPSLKCDLSAKGGFEELRAYTEITIFLDVGARGTGIDASAKMRAFQILNNFLDIYRVMSLDPHVRRVNEKRDLYFVEYALGAVPVELQDRSTHDLLENLDRVSFPNDLGPTHEAKVRLNTLEDLFPGEILPQHWLPLLRDLLQTEAQIPLDSELILDAESELRRGNYHFAVLEAETAFEVYVARKLQQLWAALGQKSADILADFESPGKLMMLFERLTGLDRAAAKLRQKMGREKLPRFVDSPPYQAWRKNLYDLRNKIVHEGRRAVTFDEAKRAIAAGKAAIHALNYALPILLDFIQIDPSVDHLQETAGRLSF